MSVGIRVIQEKLLSLLLAHYYSNEHFKPVFNNVLVSVVVI